MYEVDCKELRKLMVDHDIDSITTLSEKSGIDRGTIAKTLDGKIQPTYRVIVSFAKVFEMDSQQIGSIFFKQKVSHNETLQEGVTE